MRKLPSCSRWFAYSICLALTWSFAMIRMVGQMPIGDSVLYGPEWIPEAALYQFEVKDRGWYRVSYEELSTVLDGDILGRHIHIHHDGERVPVILEEPQVWGEGDYLLFYHQGVDGYLDQFLFEDAENQMLNPRDAMFWDSSRYYLHYDEEVETTIYSELPPDLDHTEQPAPIHAVRSQVFDESHTQKFTQFDNIQLTLSRFEEIEGFGTGFLAGMGQRYQIPVFLEDISSQSDVRLTLRMGGNTGNHDLGIYWNDDLRDTVEYSGIQVHEQSWRIDREAVLESNIVGLEALYLPSDKHTVAFCEWEYRVQSVDPSMEVETYLLGAQEGGRIDVRSDEVKYLVDLLSNTIFPLSVYGPDSSGTAMAPGQTRELVILEEAAVVDIQNIQSVELINPAELDGDYLMIVGDAFWESTEVTDYAAYRRSVAGGSYDVDLLPMSMVYRLWGYGQKHHPMALRNMAHYFQSQGQLPSHILLVGKAIEYVDMQESPESAALCHIPTFGVPGADNLLMSSQGSTVPLTSMGRLAIDRIEELSFYLDKVRQYEASLANEEYEEREWRKRVLHITGGDDEAAAIRPQMEVISEVIASGAFGAELISYDKELDNSGTLAADIISDINEGVGIKTFFGHGSVTSTDLGLDDPALFDNRDRYPLMLSLGCLTGNMHKSVSSLSEDFVFAQERGGIGYIASSGFGFISSLRRLSTSFYELLGGSMYTATIGELMQASLQDNESITALSIQLLKEQFSYHGDPAIRLHTSDLPDFVIDPVKVQIQPGLPTTSDSSFLVRFDVVNLGKVGGDSIDVRCSYDPPGLNVDIVRELRIPSPRSRQTVEVIFPVFGGQSVGQNRVDILIDPEDKVVEGPFEISESNNWYQNNEGEEGLRFVIVDESLDLLYPAAFAIENGEQVEFIAQTDYTSGLAQSFVLECDTVPFFDSELLRRMSLESEGGTLRWKMDDLNSGQEYFWRVLGAAPTGTEKVRSFLYDTSLGQGWNQSDFYQFLENEFEGMRLDSSRRYGLTPNAGFVQYSSVRSEAPDHLDISVLRYNNERISRMIGFGPISVGRSRILVSVQDPGDGKFWENPPFGQFGSDNASFPTYTYYWYSHLQEDRLNLIRFLRDSVPEGSYVYVLAGLWEDNPLGTEEWQADDTTDVGISLYDLWEEEGSLEIRSLEERGDVPFFLCYQKGAGLIQEDIGSYISQEVTGAFSIELPGTEGEMASPIIGPLSRPILRKRDNAPDSLLVVLEGMAEPGSEAVVSLTIAEDVVDLDTTILAGYNYFKLRWTMTEPEERYEDVHEYWRLTGESSADLHLGREICYTGPPEVIQSGQSIPLSVTVSNLGDQRSDNTAISFLAIDQNNHQRQWTRTIPPMEVGQEICVEEEWNTADFEGSTQIVVTLNPSREMIENSYSNNFRVFNTIVVPDRISPVLSVRVDGRVLEDYSVVGPQPRISVTLWDENQWLELELEDVRIDLFDPLGMTIPEEEWLDLVQVASEGTSNKVQKEFGIELLPQGFYTLRVQAEDASGNRALAEPYLLRFRLEPSPSLSKMVCSPNPGDENMRFRYYLTGASVPQSIEISFYDAQGKRMASITREDLGELAGGYAFTKTLRELVPEAHQWPNGLYFYTVRALQEDGSEYPEITPDRDFERWQHDKFVLQR